MTRAEERALRAYPVMEDFYRKDGILRSEPLDLNLEKRGFYRQGYEQAEKDLGWHSVDECLPEVDEEVIVLTDDLGTAPVYKIAFGHIVSKDRCLDYNGWNIPGVKYWMPCPTIPKEEEK